MAADYAGSMLASGRYNRGYDAFPRTQVRHIGQRVWHALYLALGRDVAIGEILRRLNDLSALDEYRFTELMIELDLIIDCRDPSVMGLTRDDLCHDTDWEVTRDLAKAAIAAGAQGILVPSATNLGDNLIVFPTQIRDAAAQIWIGLPVDPHLRPRSP